MPKYTKSLDPTKTIPWSDIKDRLEYLSDPLLNLNEEELEEGRQLKKLVVDLEYIRPYQLIHESAWLSHVKTHYKDSFFPAELQTVMNDCPYLKIDWELFANDLSTDVNSVCYFDELYYIQE